MNKKPAVTDANTDDFNLLLSPKLYLHKCFLRSIESPHDALKDGDISKGIYSLELSSFQALSFAVAWDRVNREDIEKEVNEKLNSLKTEKLSETTIRSLKATLRLECILQKMKEFDPVQGTVQL